MALMNLSRCSSLMSPRSSVNARSRSQTSVRARRLVRSFRLSSIALLIGVEEPSVDLVFTSEQMTRSSALGLGHDEPVVADDTIHGLDHFVADAKIDMELDEAATVESGVDGEPRAALRCLIEFKAGFTYVEHEEVSEFHGSRKLEAFTKGRSEIVGRRLSNGRHANREIKIFRRASPVEPHLKRVAALQHPTVTPRQVRVEHAGEQAIERDLASQTMEINGVATRPFEQACFEGGP